MNKMQIMPQIAWRGTKPPIGTSTLKGESLKQNSYEKQVLFANNKRIFVMFEAKDRVFLSIVRKGYTRNKQRKRKRPNNFTVECRWENLTYSW